MIAISFFGTFEKFRSQLGKSSNLLPRCGHSSPGNSKPYRACVCIEVQTLWPSKKTKENSGHKRETFKIDYIPNLKSASLMDRRKLVITWNAPSLTLHVNCPSNSCCVWNVVSFLVVLLIQLHPNGRSEKKTSSTSRPSMDSWNAWPEGYYAAEGLTSNHQQFSTIFASSNHQCFPTPTSSIIEMSQEKSRSFITKWILTIRSVFSCVLNVQHLDYQNNLLATQIFRICRLVFGLPPRARFERF